MSMILRLTICKPLSAIISALDALQWEAMTADDRIRLIRVKIERANKHIAELEDFVMQSGVLHGKSFRLDANAETGKPFLNIGSFNIYEPGLPAIIGDAVHNLRSALDHLAYHLVMVGTDKGGIRTERWENIQFPITHSADSYKSKRTAGKVEGMERKAIAAIDKLRPYKGGNEPLWLLHKLDNTNKHSFILPIGEDVIIAGVSLRASEPFFSSIGDPKTNDDMDFTGEEALIEPAVGKANVVLPTLHQLSELVSNIIASFHPLLESPTIATTSLSPLEEFDRLDWPKLPDN
jgi:hypothetical protein